MKSFSTFVEEKDQDGNPCWKGYKMVGTKKKNGKEVPNCVEEEHGAGEEGTDKLVKKYKKDTPMAEEAVPAAANAVAHGGVDMNPNGRPKRDKRKKWDFARIYRRARGLK